MNVLVTGANGFIGRALCNRLASDNKVIGVYHRKRPVDATNIVLEQAGLTDLNAVAAICEKHSPDVVIHCAGIAHQKIGAVDSATYMRVNSEATENLAKAAAKGNPDVCFVFLSSVSVYGEGPQITQITQNEKDASRKGAKAQKRKNYNGVGEDSECQPSSDYACSKLDAERRLIALSDEGIIRDLMILRLAPVYDREWSFNLDRRVVAPLNMAYMRFGSGLQRMSALARPNLVDFIEFLIRRLPRYHLPELRGGRRFSQIDIDKYPQITPRRNMLCISQGRQINADENNLCNLPACARPPSALPQANAGRASQWQAGRRNLRINVCDEEAYEFNKVIQVLKNSDIRPSRPVIPVPLPVVWLASRIAGGMFRNKRKWLHSCYDKLASSLVFDNGKMLKTGFRPRHSLETIFSSTRKN